jgi:hypothetical protein
MYPDFARTDDLALYPCGPVIAEPYHRGDDIAQCGVGVDWQTVGGNAEGHWKTIVGVVADSKNQGLRKTAMPQMFVNDLALYACADLQFLVRNRGNADYRDGGPERTALSTSWNLVECSLIGLDVCLANGGTPERIAPLAGASLAEFEDRQFILRNEVQLRISEPTKHNCRFHAGLVRGNFSCSSFDGDIL